MSAGRGVMHSEFNAAEVETHFLQIWIQPDAKGIAPGYEQKSFDDAGKRGRLQLVASGDAREGSLKLHADASLYAGRFDGDERAALALAEGRRAWVHVVRGRVAVNGEQLAAGDALALEGEAAVSIADGVGADVLVFDLP
jgi:redox-sensitive bicupin YhaK (pirin superfamily)